MHVALSVYNEHKWLDGLLLFRSRLEWTALKSTGNNVTRWELEPVVDCDDTGTLHSWNNETSIN